MKTKRTIRATGTTITQKKQQKQQQNNKKILKKKEQQQQQQQDKQKATSTTTTKTTTKTTTGTIIIFDTITKNVCDIILDRSLKAVDNSEVGGNNANRTSVLIKCLN